MSDKKILYIFGKEFTEHLNELDTNERYMALRIERFSEEFLNSDATYEDIEDMLLVIDEYLCSLDDSFFLHASILSLKQSIYFLGEHYRTL